MLRKTSYEKKIKKIKNYYLPLLLPPTDLLALYEAQFNLITLEINNLYIYLAVLGIIFPLRLFKAWSASSTFSNSIKQ